MKRIKCVCVALLMLCLLCLNACIQSVYTDSETLLQIFRENKELFHEVALEALEYGESVYISTYEYFRPEGANAEASGLYIHDMVSGTTESLESESISELFSECGVYSLGVKIQDEIRLCEFSMGSGGQYYNGIYYTDPDRALFLNNFSIPLVEDGAGFSYTVENMNYYTECWDSNFYYYVAKSK